MISSPSILITNDGNHSTDKWAMAAAARIVGDLKADNPLEEAKAEIKIAEVLRNHHDDARGDLHNRLAEDASAIVAPANLGERIGAIVRDVVAVMADSIWAEHFSKGTDYLTMIVSNFLRAQDKTDKLWHADANPDCPHAQSFVRMHAQKEI